MLFAMSANDREIDAHYIFKAASGSKEFVVGLTHPWPDPETKPAANVVAESLYNQMISAGCPGNAAVMLSDYQFLGTSVAVGTTTGDDDLGNHFEPVSGIVTGHALTPNCAVLVRKNTGAGGRANRGRMFFPPCFADEGAVDASGNIGSVYLPFWQGYLDALYARFVATDLTPMVKHQSGTRRASITITSFTVQSLLGTQRRRMR